MLIDLQNYFSSTDWLGEKTKCLSPGSSDWVGSLFSCSVVSNSLRAHGLQHTRLPCPSLSSGVCANSCPLSQGCCLTISSSVSLFCFCLQSFPASRAFLISQLFASVARVLELQLQHQSFQWIFRGDFTYSNWTEALGMYWARGSMNFESKFKP